MESFLGTLKVGKLYCESERRMKPFSMFSSMNWFSNSSSLGLSRYSLKLNVCGALSVNSILWSQSYLGGISFASLSEKTDSYCLNSTSSVISV